MPDKIRIYGSVGRSGRNLFGDVTLVQRLINLREPVPLTVDGICGPATIAAIEKVQSRELRWSQPTGMLEPDDATFNALARGIATEALGDLQIAWGAQVSVAFKTRLIATARNLGADPNHLIAAIALETGETFSPSVKNPSGATGLIQFTPSTAAELGTSTAELAAMSAVDQMDYVEKHFSPHRNRLDTLEDVYMAILWPAAVGMPDTTVLFSRPSVEYARNSGLDTDKSGAVTKQKAAALVRAKLFKGRGAGYFG
jgi:hypothetical protein